MSLCVFDFCLIWRAFRHEASLLLLVWVLIENFAPNKTKGQTLCVIHATGVLDDSVLGGIIFC
jgi:hypothetical protein